MSQEAKSSSSKLSPNAFSVFVGNLHHSTSEGDLIKLFSKFGTVTSVNYMWHKFGPNRGKPKGFGFVGMCSPEEVNIVINKLNGYELRGKKLSVSLPVNEQFTDQNVKGSSYSKSSITSLSSASSLVKPLDKTSDVKSDHNTCPSKKRESEAKDTDESEKTDVKRHKKDIHTVEERMRRLRQALSENI